MKQVSLGEFSISRSGSVNPAKFESEVFDLYSIPSYEQRKPEVLQGREIGSSKKVVQTGDVLLSRIVPHIRRVWVVGEHQGRRQIGSGEWIIYRGNSFDPNYLRHYLLSDPFHQQFMKTISGVGGSLMRARPSEVEKIKVPLPSLEEQKRLAAILDKADAIRKKRKQAIELTEQFLLSAFLDMFGDPITNPKEWERPKLEALGTLDRGKSKHRPRNDPKLLGGQYPLIQTGDVAASKGAIKEYTSTYSEIGLKQSRLWPTGTLCITIAANIAKTGILTFDACFPDSVVGFTPNERTTTEFIQFWLSFYQHILEETAPESAQKNINLKILRELKIPCPPIELQNEFTAIVEKTRKVLSRFEIIGQADHNLFSTLTQRAFRGEL